MTESDLNYLQSACDALIASQQTLLLASQAANGDAEISYAPYLRTGAVFYIFVSELARHTHNLLARPTASIMFIEPESAAANLFARQRLIFFCQAREIAKTESDYAHILESMAGKFGSVVAVLRTLPDFHLLALTPQQGQFVAGFGKAMPVDADGRLQAFVSPN